MTTATTHPDPESLAAFADGRLAGAERVTVIEHLARCDDCLDVVAETGAVQEELQEELEDGDASSTSGASTPNIVLHPSAWTRWAPAAAALAAALVVAVFGAWQMGWLLGPDLSVETLANRLEGSAARLGDEAWAAHGWPTYRDAGPSTGARTPTPLEVKKASFRAGVHAVDLQLALRLGNRERATAAAEDLVETLRDLPDIGLLAGSYRHMAVELESEESVQEIARQATAAEDRLVGLINELYYELGKWAEAGRLAAAAGDRDTLRSHSLRGALEDFRAAGLDEDITARLGEIRERLWGDLSDDELERLERDFREIVGGEGVRLDWQDPVPPTDAAEE